MKRIALYTIHFLIALVVISCSKSDIKYPKTKKIDQSDMYFGVEVKDPYRWLEDDNSDETKAWVKSQNEVTFNYLNQIPYRNKIKNRISELWNYERISAPRKKGNKYFYRKNDGLQDQSVLYYQNNLNDKPKVLIDPNKLSEEGTTALSNYNISKDGKYIAYSISKSGSDWQEILIKEIETGKQLEDKLNWVKFSGIAWYNNGFFYSRYNKPESGDEYSKINQFHKVYYHVVGTDQNEDKLIFENNNYAKRNYYAYVTSDEKYLIISESETTSGNSIYIRNLTRNTDDFTQLTTSFEYEYRVIDHVNDNIFVLTNYKAPKYKLIKINVNSLDIGNWKDIIPEKSEVLEFVDLTKTKIVAGYIKHAHTKLEIYSINGRYEGEHQLPGIGNVTEFNGTRYDTEAFYNFTSFTTPGTIYKFDTKNNQTEIFYKPKVLVDDNQFVTKQVTYRSKDNTKIRMFIVHKKGIQLDGNNPTLLYGYGGFNISILPSFKVGSMVWLENGGIYASANIRGGGEYGENWHLAGMEFNKQNVFDDFIHAAMYLINEGYTSSDYLAINGRSNGGLLIGAVTNQRPDLFKVALPAVGVMDMLRFHKFTIGWAWVGDYGSSEDSAQFINLYNYSPLHNISKKKDYPAVLVFTADHDDRVVPAHSFKYIATLQNTYRGPNPVLIRIQTKAGHGRGMPVSMRIDEVTDLIAFSFYNMNVNPIY